MQPIGQIHAHCFIHFLTVGHIKVHTTQPDFGQVYKVKDENMKKLDCASFPMVCGPMFLWSGPPGATKNFFAHGPKGGPQ